MAEQCNGAGIQPCTHDGGLPRDRDQHGYRKIADMLEVTVQKRQNQLLTGLELTQGNTSLT